MVSLQAVKALIFVLMALSVAVAIRPRFDDDRVSGRIIAYWMLGAVIGFLTPIDSIKLVSLAILAFLLTPKKLEDRPAFYLCVFFALPFFVYWRIPFPGINYLIRLNHGMMMSLIVCLPMIFMGLGLRRNQKDPVPKNRTLDATFMITVMLIMVLSARDTTFTNAIRIAFNTLVTYMIPYLAVTKGLRSRDAFLSLRNGFTTVAAMITFLGLLTLFQNWNHYDLTGDTAAFATTSARGGSRRINLTMMHTLAGLALAAAFMAFWFSARHAKKLQVMAYPMLFFSFLGVLGTQSRGAYLGFMFMIGTIIVLRIKSWPIRIMLGGCGLAGVIAVFVLMQSSGFSTVDAYGTFTYRQELLDAGLSYVPQHFWVGSVGYVDDPHFAHLVQGQGIIDFVNGYLQYALRWGMLGLGLFVILWIWSIIAGVKAMDRFTRNGPEDIEMRSIAMGYLGLYAALLVSFLTTSDASYYPTLIVVMIAIGQALNRVSKIPLPKDESASIEDETPDPTEAALTAPIDTTPGMKGAWS